MDTTESAEHRRHVCPENDLDVVCSPDHPWCEECMEDWPCPTILAAATVVS